MQKQSSLPGLALKTFYAMPAPRMFKYLS